MTTTPDFGTFDDREIRDAIADALHTDIIDAAEATIRDLAASVVNAAAQRVDHPTYDNTKTTIRTKAANLEGAIGLFMVLTKQANHAGVPRLAHFTDPRTRARVYFARQAVDNL